MAKPGAPGQATLAEQAALYLRAMQQLNEGVVRQLRPILTEKHGMDLRNHFILALVDRGLVHPGMISQSMHLPNSIITRHLDQLVSRGFLVRSLDAKDSRRIRLSLTSAGRRVSKEVAQTFTAIVGSRLKRVSPGRRKDFLSTLSELANDMDHS
jgi:DNA-binding MarR family transcriptional regulator